MNTQLELLRSALHAGVLDGGLAFLNDTVAHRSTALYRLQGLKLKNIALAGEIKPEYLDEVALEVSFCQFVMRDGLFRTSDSGQDARLDGHPYKGVMLAYHGVPVLDDRGELYGTLCHFDLAQRDISDEQFAFMTQAARVIPAFLPRLNSA